MGMSKKSKIILLIIAGVLVVAALVTGLLLWQSAARRARTTVVGFYDIDAKQQEAVQDVLQRAFNTLPGAVPADAATAEGTSTEEAPMLEFITLTGEQAADPKLTKKIDVLITQTGALTTSLMTKAAAVSAEIASRFPRTTQSSPYFSLDDQLVVMPLFLDHFETAYYTVLQNELDASLPVYLSDFAEYAERAHNSVTYPIIASGADDTVLFAMVSALVESVAGADGYQDFVKRMEFIASKGYSLDRTLELPLTGDAPEGVTFNDILWVLKRWRLSGLILGDWYSTKENVERVFMEDYHTGIVQMLLSQHRRMPYPAIKYYEATQFPADTSVIRALIAPSVSYMQFADTAVTKAFAAALSSAEEQETLSVATQLAPTTLRGQSFDRQADDVRFMAATNAGGPVPEIGRAAFASETRRADFAAFIREFLSD